MGQLGRSFRATILFTRLAGIAPRPLYAQLLADHHYNVLNSDQYRDGHIDVVLIDCLSRHKLLKEDHSFLEDIKIHHPESAIMFLTDLDAPYAFQQRLKRYGTVCPAGDLPKLILPKLQRLLENLSLADECGDRLKTLSSLNRVVSPSVELQTPKTAANVLVTGNPSPDLLRISSALVSNGVNVTFALSVPQTLRYLDYRSFDSLVVVPGKKDAVYTSLLKLLRRNDKTKSLPALVFDSPKDKTDTQPAYRYLQQGADLVLNEREIERAIMPEIRSFARRNRLTKSMRTFLRKSVKNDTQVPSFVSDLPFFETHLARQCATSNKYSRHLCLSILQLKTESGLPTTPQLCKQAISYIELLIQDTDLMTVIQDDLILLSQPCTSLVDANSVRKQIVSLLQELKFKSSFGADEYEDLNIWSCTVGHIPHEVPEEMITRALKSLSETPRPVTPRKRPTLTVVQ